MANPVGGKAPSEIYANPELQLLNKKSVRLVVKDIRDVYKVEKKGEPAWQRLVKVVILAVALVLMVTHPIGVFVAASMLGLVIGYEAIKAGFAFSAQKATKKVFDEASAYRLTDRIQAFQTQQAAQPQQNPNAHIAAGRVIRSFS